jgi:YidC/Oxa1 family membrane protein insertase
MKKLAPELAKLKERFADDKERLTQETMALYKKAGANPIAGCAPLLVQIPVFFSLYKVLYVTIEMWHAPFYGWIHDLSSPDPTTIFNLFGLIPWTPPAFLPVLGVWPLIYCATMYIQQMMQPPPPDPVQARMMKAMPFVFTLMMGNFPAGLLIYWSWNNTLSVLQQWLITRRLDSLSARVPQAAE